MNSKGSFFTIILLMIILLGAVIFIFVPVSYYQLTNISEEIPYQVPGLVTEKEYHYSNESYDVQKCGLQAPDINIRAVADGDWTEEETHVRYVCSIFNKEDQVIEITYKLDLGSKVAFSGSSPSGLFESTVKTKINPKQAYTSPTMYFNRGTIQDYTAECRLLDWEQIYKCVNETRVRNVITYTNITKNGTITKYNITIKEVEKKRLDTLLNITKEWLKK